MKPAKCSTEEKSEATKGKEEGRRGLYLFIFWKSCFPSSREKLALPEFQGIQ